MCFQGHGGSTLKRWGGGLARGLCGCRDGCKRPTVVDNTDPLLLMLGGCVCCWGGAGCYRVPRSWLLRPPSEGRHMGVLVGDWSTTGAHPRCPPCRTYGRHRTWLIRWYRLWPTRWRGLWCRMFSQRQRRGTIGHNEANTTEVVCHSLPCGLRLCHGSAPERSFGSL